MVCATSSAVPLEDQLHSQLDLARAAYVAASRSGRGDLAELGRIEAVFGLRKIGVVHDIEHLTPELDTDLLGDIRGFIYGEVQIPHSGRSEDVAAGITETGVLLEEAAAGDSRGWGAARGQVL